MLKTSDLYPLTQPKQAAKNLQILPVLARVAVPPINDRWDPRGINTICPTTTAGASLTTVSPPLSPELEMPQVTPPRMGQHGVADQAVVSAPTRVGHPGADNAAPPVSRAQSLLAQLEARVCIPLDTPLLSTPRLRRSKTPSRVVRRSGRLAAKTKASNLTLQAQNVLKQKLGIADRPHGPDPVALDSLKALFVASLSPSKIEALQALFAPGFDPIAMELNLTGFEDDALYPFSR